MPVPVMTAVTTAINASGTVLSITKPGSPATGDLLVAILVDYDVATTVTPPAGWTERAVTDWTGPTEITYVTAFERVVDGSEGASISFTWSATSYLSGALCLVTGATATPYDTHASTAANGSTSASLPAVTTTGGDDLLIGFELGYNAAVSVDPSGWATQATWDTVNRIWTQSAPTAGTYGPTSFTLASGSTTVAGVLAYSGASGGAVQGSAPAPTFAKVVGRDRFAPTPYPVSWRNPQRGGPNPPALTAVTQAANSALRGRFPGHSIPPGLRSPMAFGLYRAPFTQGVQDAFYEVFVTAGLYAGALTYGLPAADGDVVVGALAEVGAFLSSSPTITVTPSATVQAGALAQASPSINVTPVATAQAGVLTNSSPAASIAASAIAQAGAHLRGLPGVNVNASALVEVGTLAYGLPSVDGDVVVSGLALVGVHLAATATPTVAATATAQVGAHARALPSIDVGVTARTLAGVLASSSPSVTVAVTATTQAGVLLRSSPSIDITPQVRAFVGAHARSTPTVTITSVAVTHAGVFVSALIDTGEVFAVIILPTGTVVTTLEAEADVTVAVARAVVSTLQGSPDPTVSRSATIVTTLEGDMQP